jgi:serine/threonine protein phosphatase PrpC
VGVFVCVVQFTRDYFHHFLVRSSFFPDSLSEAMKDAYMQTERSFMALAPSKKWESGCTAATVLVQGDRLVVGNVGDSRVVLCRRGHALPLTKDHSPNDADELERIEKEGAFVKEGMVRSWRACVRACVHACGVGCECGADERAMSSSQVSNLLGVARSIGDYDCRDGRKIPGVSAEPDIRELLLQDDAEFLLVRWRAPHSYATRPTCATWRCRVRRCHPPRGATLVVAWSQLACDGLWEKFSNESAVNFVRRDLQRGDCTVQEAVTRLVKQALILNVWHPLQLRGIVCFARNPGAYCVCRRLITSRRCWCRSTSGRRSPGECRQWIGGRTAALCHFLLHLLVPRAPAEVVSRRGIRRACGR